MLRAVIADILGTVNIINIADITTDIADIVNITRGVIEIFYNKV